MGTYLKQAVIAVCAFIALLGGFLYVQDLKGDIQRLQTVITVQQESIKRLDQQISLSREELKNYRLEVQTKDVQFQNARRALDEAIKNAKGINRVVDAGVINSLCSTYEGKYCSQSLYTDRTVSTVQQTDAKR